MATILYNDSSVIGAWLNGFEPDTGNASAILLDAHTNKDTLAAVSVAPQAYLVIDGVLTRDGAPVVINPPCDDCAALDALDSATTVAQLKKALIVMRDKPGFTRG